MSPASFATQGDHTVSGLVRVEDRRKGKVWVAAYFRSDGRKVRKTVGMAWVRDSGTRTARGAVVWRSGSGPKPNPSYLTPKEAAEKLEALLHDERVAPKRARPQDRHRTVEDLVAGWLTHSRKVKGVTDSTYRSYESIGGAIRKSLGARQPVRAITIDGLNATQTAMLDAGKSRATVHHHFTALRHALDLAVAAGWLEANPADGLIVVPLPKVEPDFNVLEPSQVEAVANAIAEITEDELPRMRNGAVWEDIAAKFRRTRALWSDLVRVAAYTGLRIGELRALQWGDVSWQGTTLRVARKAPASAPPGSNPKAPKSGKARSVPLIPLALAALRRVAKLGHPNGPGELIFPSLGGGLFDAGRVRTAFYEGLGAAGLGYLRAKSNPMTFHDLRHTFGTIAARVFPLADVQAYLGHADIGTTMRYAHHIPRTDAARQRAQGFELDLAR